MAKESKNNINIFASAFSYIKDNLIIGYSFVLLLLVPAAFLANNYFINTDYAKKIDTITMKKAVLAEDILDNLVYDKLSDPAALQAIVNRIKRNSDEIIYLSILEPRAGKTGYEIIASSDAESVGKERQDDPQFFLARTDPNGGAQLGEDRGERFWRVIKAIRDRDGNSIGFMEMSLSLAESDASMNEVITRSYWVLALIILALVLLQANQMSLLQYALSLNKLKEVDKMKDMFISMASHELRSPLTAIKGYLELMREDKNLVLGGDTKRYFENISVSEKRLEHLVEDMLEVSRLEGNRFPLEINDFDPDPMIRQSVEEMRSQAIQKNLVLEYEPPATPVAVKADASRFKQVVVNLIGNALKYTEKGTVKVITAIKKNDLLITVADTGVGISSEERANLFQKFYRAKNERTKNITGTGLGLWITMETVRRMKGKITVDSIEGVGSHFTIYLPLAKKQA